MKRYENIKLLEENYKVFNDLINDEVVPGVEEILLKHKEYVILLSLYRTIIDKQNIKIKTLKNRRNKWKYLATTASEEERAAATDSFTRKKNIYKSLYNLELQKKIRELQLENKKIQQINKELNEELENTIEDYEDLQWKMEQLQK